MADSGLLRISDVVAETQLHRMTVHRAIKSGELKVFKFGRSVRIDRSDLEAWKASKRAENQRGKAAA